MSGYKGKIINSGNDAKTIKGNGDKYETAIFYGKSYKQFIDGKEYNTCSMAKIASCFKGCLYSSGRGKFNNVQEARTRKTTLFFTDRKEFLRLYQV
jgi:hypothetical protein